ncbi:hypothetical protein CONLIGDRAFT_719946 [Coniochaeta ligniaria NRRL 30616]|uniref:Uncharacterized protein n=1 Tax=Coniochaeta ligniaria NRRL 30616 TaxID=1408157 RepID=A0A1J7J4F5_9PEZI|nr:hypothetical protein CONLIGDRAFT_719946 [Coniochaeta ligniaria NRRL 30616]
MDGELEVERIAFFRWATVYLVGQSNKNPPKTSWPLSVTTGPKSASESGDKASSASIPAKSAPAKDDEAGTSSSNLIVVPSSNGTAGQQALNGQRTEAKTVAIMLQSTQLRPASCQALRKLVFQDANKAKNFLKTVAPLLGGGADSVSSATPIVAAVATNVSVKPTTATTQAITSESSVFQTDDKTSKPAATAVPPTQSKVEEVKVPATSTTVKLQEQEYTQAAEQPLRLGSPGHDTSAARRASNKPMGYVIR